MAQGSLHGHHVTAGSDEAASVEVAAVVHGQAHDARSPAGSAPVMSNSVLVGRLARGGPEDPLGWLLTDAPPLEVPGQQVEEAVRDGYDALAAVLRLPKLDRSARRALHLAA